MITVNSLIKISSIALLFLFGSANVFAQVPVASATPSCPTVNVSAPDSVSARQNITMSANVSGGDDDNVTPTYNWTVSNGTIEAGQGTSTITITTKGLKGDSTITATVDVGGYDRSCSTSDSETTVIIAGGAEGGAEARLFDEFSILPNRELNARLKNFALDLRNDATVQGYVIVSPLRSAKVTAQQVASKAKVYLTKSQRISPSRIIAGEGRNRGEMMIELWIVPQAAAPPEVTIADPGKAKTVKKAPAKKTKGKKA